MLNPGLKGFSLTELLVALLIIGNIAAFSIPKILNSQQNSQKKAVFRETLSAVNEIMYLGMMKGEIRADNNGTYIISKLNATKICPVDVNLGCWTPAMGTMTSLPGVVLPNGAVIAEMEDCCDNGGGQWSNDFIMDWNGDKPPNLVGDDQLWLGLCFGTADCNQIYSTGKPGRLNSPPFNGASNQALFEWVFTR
jgi:prepilin-type N-terminal cleavage/methylation domain-containing protein